MTSPFCLLGHADIDECSEGFIQCDSRASCVNLPGWYHCECRDGYHDSGLFAPSGESCEGRYRGTRAGRGGESLSRRMGKGRLE